MARFLVLTTHYSRLTTHFQESIHGHSLGGAKHASLKGITEPLYPGGTWADQFHAVGVGPQADRNC